MSDSIVVLDSSDEEEPPQKKMKSEISIKRIKNTVQNLQIAEIKSLIAEDVVVIDDEEECIEIKDKDPLNGIKTARINGHSSKIPINDSPSKINIVKNKMPQRRVAIITLDSKMVTDETILSDIPDNNFANLRSITDREFNPSDLLKEDEDSANLLEVNQDVTTNGIQSDTNTTSTTTCNNEDKPNAISDEFQSFLDICVTCESSSKYKDLIEQKIPKLKTKYEQAREASVQCKHFKKLLLTTIENIKRKPSDLIIFFNDIYQEIGTRKKKDIKFSGKEERNLKKLHSVLKKISRKIKDLESSDCNWEDESNSAYLMESRYKQRAALIYKKICSIENENPYATRKVHKNLCISCSKYTEINRAVDKMYSKNKEFPMCHDIDKCIRKCVKRHNLPINEVSLQNEVSKMFRHVGDVLIRRRKLETYETLSVFNKEDVQEDPDLEELLKQRHIENENRINAVIDKFSENQEKGEDPRISSDSDDSNYKSEEESSEN